MVSVGALAALINIVALIFLTICERIAKYILSYFSESEDIGVDDQAHSSGLKFSILQIPIKFFQIQRFPGMFYSTSIY